MSKVQSPKSAHRDFGPGTWDFGPSVAAIRRRWPGRARTAVILGTGLGELAAEIDAEAVIPYGEIRGFPRSTALAHKGRLVCGRLAGSPVVMMQGRCHLYEGHALADIVRPVQVLRLLGIERLIVTNAAGGLNPALAVGDVMLIDDHICLMGAWGGHLACQTNGREDPDWQAGSLPHGCLYDRELAAQAEQIARRGGFPLRRGVYLGVLGPSYETRAEYRAFRRLGGDCVGMSTIPEVLAAAACGLKILGLSTITNVARPDAPKVVSAQEVVEVAATTLPKIRRIVAGMIAKTL